MIKNYKQLKFKSEVETNYSGGLRHVIPADLMDSNSYNFVWGKDKLFQRSLIQNEQWGLLANCEKILLPRTKSLINKILVYFWLIQK